MTKQENKEFEKEVKKEFDAIRYAIKMISQKMATKYEKELYKRIRTFCDEQLEIIKDVDEYQIDFTCKEIKKAMQEQ